MPSIMAINAESSGQDHNTAGKIRIARLTRIYHFCASHRLNSPFLNSEENEKVFGKCGLEAGHGHNYVLKITVKGPVDPVSGRVVHLGDLDDIVNERIISLIDHKNLNILFCDAPILTSEVVISEIWKLLKPHIPLLYKIDLNETKKNSFEYKERT